MDFKPSRTGDSRMNPRTPKPAWLRRRIPPPGRYETVSRLLDGLSLHTVCQEAVCPNQGECFGRGTATFLLLGPYCSRACTFCAVETFTPAEPDPSEPERIAVAALRLKLSYLVLTMVTRDDLADHGALHVAETIRKLKKHQPDIGVEVLISDLGGSMEALETVLSANPGVLNHNIETAPRFYSAVRPQADYSRSIELIRQAVQIKPGQVTKSGLMLGFGETNDEILKTMADIREAGCDLITLGQYLAPSDAHHPVVEFIHPDKFDDLKEEALKMGFKGVASGPYVRSSYRAQELYEQAIAEPGIIKVIPQK